MSYQKIQTMTIKRLQIFTRQNLFTRDYGVQNMFVYQPTQILNTLSFGDQKEYIFQAWCIKSWFLPKVKYFNKKLIIQLNNTPLDIEENNYTTKIVNVYIVYDLDDWPKNPLRNFALKNCLLGATNIVKNNEAEKYVYSDYVTAFDGKGSWNFDDDFDRNVIM